MMIRTGKCRFWKKYFFMVFIRMIILKMLMITLIGKMLAAISIRMCRMKMESSRYVWRGLLYIIYCIF